MRVFPPLDSAVPRFELGCFGPRPLRLSGGIAMQAGSVLTNWRTILQTQNLPRGSAMDVVSRWLLITRASVFSMTATSALIGGLLAASTGKADWRLFALAAVGLIVAHAANNMINDYFDVTGGVDTDGYARTVYAPHPILSGLVSRRGLLGAIAVCNLLDLVVLAVLCAARGPLVVGFALTGLFISVFYVAPPLKLKHRGLGEPSVFLVWGPLMICGTYFVTTGELSGTVVLASIPYALLVTTVLIGKHIDKLASDTAKGIRTLPVLMGETTSLTLNRVLMAGFFVFVTALTFGGVFGLWLLVVLLALPRLRETWNVYRQPRPAQRPAGYPIWPLWYVAWAFRLNRLAGGLFILGLALNVVVPVYV